MAGKYGSASIVVAYDDAAGGSPQTITNYVLTMSGLKITSRTQPGHAMGDSWEETIPTGMMSGDPITLEGYWDTTATSGPHVVFQAPDDGPQDSTRTLTVTLGDSKTWSCETRLISYEIKATVGELHKFSAVIVPTGTVTITA